MESYDDLRIVESRKCEWQYCLSGDWSITYHIQKGPHWLGRFLQKWLLDIHWKKIID